MFGDFLIDYWKPFVLNIKHKILDENADAYREVAIAANKTILID